MNRVVSGTTLKEHGDFALDSIDEDRLLRLFPSYRPRAAVWLNQVHGDTLVFVGSSDHGLLGDGDALATNLPDILLTVRTADCVPVFITGPSVIALVHAGFDGVVKGILAKSLAAITDKYGPAPNTLRVRFGPHICPKCYNLREEVVKKVAKNEALQPHLKTRRGKTFLDLAGALQDQAETAGALVDQVPVPCTKHEETYYSYRGGDGDSRQLSYMMLTDA